MTRQLATIQKIKSIEPHPTADSLEIATVLGWQCVVKKDEFKIGDLCIYCEVDSVLPDRPEFEFLRKNKFRIKAMKIRGQLSMGIIFPMSILFNTQNKLQNMYIQDFGIGVEKGFIEFRYEDAKVETLYEGDDITGLLGIIKYDPPEAESGMGNSGGNFPSHLVPKTDEIRIQSCIEVLEELKGKPWFITQKMDGTSCSIIWNNGINVVCDGTNNSDQDKDQKIIRADIHRTEPIGLTVCTRNHIVKPDVPNFYWDMVKKYDLENKFKKFFPNMNIALQAEICGPGIQKNRIGLQEKELFIFNVYLINEKRYANFTEFMKICCDEFGLSTVPCIAEGDRFNWSLDGLTTVANRGKYLNGHQQEGIVVRPQIEMWSETLQGRLSFKVVSSEYLLKE